MRRDDMIIDAQQRKTNTANNNNKTSIESLDNNDYTRCWYWPSSIYSYDV